MYMAIKASISRRDITNRHTDNHLDDIAYESDNEIKGTEEDLIENYIYLTQRCGMMGHSPTIDTINQSQKSNKKINEPKLTRQLSVGHTSRNSDYTRSFPKETRPKTYDDLSDSYQANCSTISRKPLTVYFNSTDDPDHIYHDRSFSVIKLFSRMKERLVHDRRYKSKSTHQLLNEEDTPDWLELTKNIRHILTKALLPDGGYDARLRQSQISHSRRNSQKRSRDYAPVLSKEIEDNDEDDKIYLNVNEDLNTKDSDEHDRIVWNNFLKCSRGSNYRRCGICKAIDRQQYQGQLIYVYGVANNILIDENLKASGLG